MKSKFVVAGNYAMKADFVTSRLNEGDYDENYEELNNNYKPIGAAVDVVMKKYDVHISWYKKCDDSAVSGEPYTTPCEYDATYHGLTAKGKGINDAEMGIETAGVFSAKDAGSYTASVSKIKTGTDTVMVDGTEYKFDYELNYTLSNSKLEWAIDRRPITVTVGEGNFLSKIYDGNAAFAFDADGYTKSFIADKQNENVVNINVTYLTKYSAFANSHFGYYINNVMAVDKNDVFMPISMISADKVNVTAQSATVFFGNLSMTVNSNGIYNYVIESVADGKIHSNKTGEGDIITPRDVDMRFYNLSHIYNGETFIHEFTYADGINGGVPFKDEYGFTLFMFYNEDVPMKLVQGNNIVGAISIGGNINAGAYKYVVEIKVVDAETDGAENYNITIPNLDDVGYTIEQREIAVNYSALLQSRQSPFTDVGVEIDLEKSSSEPLNKDLIVAGSGGAALSALNALLARDSFALSVSNDWKEGTYDAYTRINGATCLVGETTESALTVFISSNNYKIAAPVLQITYLKIENAEEFKFLINNLDDLLHLDSDSFGLGEARDETGYGSVPTFTQTADIDGVVDGSYTVMPSIRYFRGNYEGQNHFIKSIVSPQNADAQTEDKYYAGFFARITEGSVSNLTLADIQVYGFNNISAAGGFAGLVSADVAVNNVTLNASVYVRVSSDGEAPVNIGGFVGSAENANIDTVYIGVKLSVVNVGSALLNVGGMAGKIDCGRYQSISVFADISVNSQYEGSYFGGIAGYVTGDELTIQEYRYLASSIYLNDGVSAVLCDKAFGSGVADEITGDSYDAFMASADSMKNIITSYMIRAYLLPTGADGTAENPIQITNYRQIPLIIAYPYMNFKLIGEIRSPLKMTTYNRGFYGTINIDDGSIRSYHAENTSDIPLTDAIKKNVVVITVGKKEDA